MIVKTASCHCRMIRRWQSHSTTSAHFKKVVNRIEHPDVLVASSRGRVQAQGREDHPMYNEAFMRAALAERARDREAASLAQLRRDEPARDRRRPVSTSCAYLRDIPASV